MTTREELLKLAEQAGHPFPAADADFLERFAALLQAQGEPVLIPPEWFEHGAIVPVTVETVGLLLRALKRPSQAKEHGGEVALNHAESRVDSGNDRGAELSESGAVDELPPLPAPAGTMQMNWGTPYAKDIDAYTEAQMRGYVIDYRLSRAQATQPAQQAPAVSDLMVDMTPPATSRDRWMYEQGRLAERDPRSQPAAAPVSEQKSHQQHWDECAKCSYGQRHLIHTEFGTHAFVAPSNQSQGGDKP
jgi:hypothetical protein